MELEIPQGIQVEIKEKSLAITKNGKTFEVSFDNKIINVKVGEGHLIFNAIGKLTRSKAAQIGTVAAHVRNAFIGITTGFSKKLQVVYSHFPVSIEVKGNQVAIKNFLGEKVPRTAKVIGDSKIEAKGQEVFVTGSDKFSVGQTANNLMTATRIAKKDRRIFQDGIYLVS